ncbi:MAG: hypothetical protein Q9183_001390 [Haloplaca sp. 2 TL-2023]
MRSATKSSDSASDSVNSVMSAPEWKSSVSSTDTPSRDVARNRMKELQGTPNAHTVIVPDMFASIMAVRPVVNPYYHDVKPKADAWITKIIQADEKWDAKNRKVDLCYLASIWASSCDEEALRMMVDWNHWVSVAILSDEGPYSQDPAAEAEEIKQTYAVMEDTEPPVRVEDNPIRYVFQTCWDRLKQVFFHTRLADPFTDLQERWKEMHKRFFDGLLNQVQCQLDQRRFTRDVQDYMDMRRGTIGAYPAIALTEYVSFFHYDWTLRQNLCVLTLTPAPGTPWV